MSFFILKKQSLIGIDLTADEIRLVKIAKHKTNSVLIDAAIRPISSGGMRDGKIQDPAKISRAIQEMLSQAGIKKGIAAIALPTNSAMIKRFQIPEGLTIAEWEAELVSRLDYYLPGMTEEVCYDYQMTTAQEMTFIAARQQQLTEYMRVVTNSGLDVKIVDITAHALVRGARLLIDEPICLLIHLDQQESEFIVFQNEEIIFNQTFLTMHLEQQLQAIIQLFHSTHRDIKIETVLLAGKITTNVCRFIKENLQLTTKVADPLAKIAKEANADILKFSDISSRMLLSCGLALRSMHARN